jgi:hypothetical protein
MEITPLPFNLADEIKVFPNEYINSITMNRGNLRLLYNDQQIIENLSTLNAVSAPASQNMYLVSYDDAGNIKYDWITQDEVKTSLGYANALSDLSDVVDTTPQSGHGLRYDASEGKYILQFIPLNLSEFEDVEFISIIKDDDGLVYSEEYGKFINVPYLGTPRVGFTKIYYIEESTWLKLPSIEGFGDGAQITVCKSGTTSNIYITPFSGQYIGEGLVTESIVSDNTSEDSACIVLRAKVTESGDKKWIIVSAFGTWGYEISSTYISETNIIEPTYSEVILAPFDSAAGATYKKFVVDDSLTLPVGMIDVSTDAKWVGTRYEGHLLYKLEHNFLSTPHLSFYYRNSSSDLGFKELNSVTTILDDSDELNNIYIDLDPSEILFVWPPPTGFNAEIVVSK